MSTFKLTPPDIRLVIDSDVVPGGLDQWGSGALEVTVRGGVSLAEFLDLVDRLSSLPTNPRDFDSGQLERMRSAFRDFGGNLVAWNIEGIEAGSEGFLALPWPLAIGIFSAYQQAGAPDPFSPAASANGAPSLAASAPTGLSL